MKYNKSAIMTRAWELKKENTENIFGECLKMAWNEAKGLQVTSKKILYGRMTLKQKKFIFTLLKELESKNVKVHNNDLYFAGNGFDMYLTSKMEASKDIEFLLGLKKIAK